MPDLRYNLVPKGIAENLHFRRHLVDGCMKDSGLAAAIKELCKHDFLFWLNTFGWTHDPRNIDKGTLPVLPFITYPFQDDTLKSLEVSFGREDVVIVKTRDMGASWMVMMIFTHRWQFFKHLTLGAVSKEEKLVDGSPKSLFAKVQFCLDRQPGFLLPKYNHTHLLFQNYDTGSSMEGASTTGQMLRGDRYTCVMMDEMGAYEFGPGQAALASTQFTTNSRFLNSTPQGAIGAFYEMAHNRHVKRIDLPWTLHPEKVKGSYRTHSGELRSPWYDREWERMPIPALFAQEVCLDFAGSSSPFFPPEMLDRCILEDVRPPIYRGDLEFDAHEHHLGKFVESTIGDLYLWMLLKDGRPPEGEQYVIGCDISQGTGASNSVLAVADKKTREKVAELATSSLSPDRFADLALAVARWFNDAYLIWEMNGPGGAFGKRLVVDLGYRNVYYRKDEQGLEGKTGKSMVPGWFVSPANKMLVFREYVRALGNGSFKNRSREALAECRQYVYLPNGTVGNARAQAISDPSGARVNHGDRPTADALANKALGAEPDVAQRDENDLDHLPANPPFGSLAWRRMKAAEDSQMQLYGHWESNQSASNGWKESGSLVSQGW